MKIAPSPSLCSRALRRAARILSVLCALCAIVCLARDAFAHQSSVVYSEIRASGRDVEVTLQLSNNDLYQALELDKDRPATLDEARNGATKLGAYLLGHLLVKNHGYDCAGEAEDHNILEKESGFFFVQSLRFHCLRSLEEAEITYNLFFDIDPRHQGLCRVNAFGSDSEQVFREQSRTLKLGRPLGILDNVRDYLNLGIEHIFTGYDHLAFLFGLLFIAAPIGARKQGAGEKRAGMRSGLGYVIRIVTAFTIAHSVTLCSSALGLVELPSRFVESFIAVSIGYVALENILQPQPRHRFLLTFCFGLVHGFGFASVLKEMGLPKAGLLWSLLSFNLGVEFGQLAVVTLGFPVLYLLALHGLPSPQPASAKAARPRRALPYRPVEILLLTVLLSLCVVMFLRFNLPPLTVCVVALGIPGILLLLVPRYGYDRCVRIGASGLLLALSVLWLIERAFGHPLFRGLLG